jgi:hypothetical protein
MLPEWISDIDSAHCAPSLATAATQASLPVYSTLDSESTTRQKRGLPTC